MGPLVVCSTAWQGSLAPVQPLGLYELTFLFTKYPALGFGLDPVPKPVSHGIIFNPKQCCKPHHFIESKLSCISDLLFKGIEGDTHLYGDSCLTHYGKDLGPFLYSTILQPILDTIESIGPLLLFSYLLYVVCKFVFHNTVFQSQHGLDSGYNIQLRLITAGPCHPCHAAMTRRDENAGHTIEKLFIHVLHGVTPRPRKALL